jgi:ParB family chromosome partitioning protein
LSNVSAPDKKKIGLPPKRRMRHDRHFVDELSQRMGEGIGRMIRVTTITSNQDQPRTNLGSLDDLVASIGKYGVLEPLLVRRRNGQYELVSGERRFHAAMQAGLTEVPCIELSVKDDQALEIALVENLQRKDLNPFEEAEGLRTLVEKYAYTHERVAEAVGRSRVTVTESLKILDIPADLREICRHADITAKGILLEIAKAKSRKAMQALIKEIVEHSLDRDAIRRRRQQLADEGADSDKIGKKQKPFVINFRSPNRWFRLSLSFRTPEEPEPTEVIAALEQVINKLKEDMNAGG